MESKKIMRGVVRARQEATRCACDLVEPPAGAGLKVLRDAGRVTSDKRGVNVWYPVTPGALEVLRDDVAPAR